MPKLTKAQFLDRIYLFPDNTSTFNSAMGRKTVRLISLAGMEGGYDPLQGDRPPHYGTSLQASIMIYVQGAKDYEQARDDLTGLIDTLMEISDFGMMRLSARFEGETLDRYCYAILEEAGTAQSAEQNGEIFISIPLSFVVPDGLWYYPNENAGPIYGTGKLYGDGNIYGGGGFTACSGLSTDFTVSNNGNSTIPIVINVSLASTQSITTIKVQRIVDSVVIKDEVAYNAAISGPSTFYVDCRSLTVTVGGSDGYTDDFSALTPYWFQLPPGDNTIRVLLGDVSDACKVKLSFDHPYRR